MSNLIQTAHNWFDLDAIIMVENRGGDACLVVYDRVTPDGQFVTAVLHGATAQELMALLAAREAAQLHAWEAQGFAAAQDDAQPVVHNIITMPLAKDSQEGYYHFNVGNADAAPGLGLCATIRSTSRGVALAKLQQIIVESADSNEPEQTTIYDGNGIGPFPPDPHEYVAAYINPDFITVGDIDDAWDAATGPH